MIIAALCRPNQTGEIRYPPRRSGSLRRSSQKHQADLIAALGENGAGKSTLIKVMAVIAHCNRSDTSLHRYIQPISPCDECQND
jgi:ABC-type phosphate/phosphonate transport system ATPase subunit